MVVWLRIHARLTRTKSFPGGFLDQFPDAPRRPRSARVRRICRRLRRSDVTGAAGAVARERAHALDLCGGPRGRPCLPQPTVRDDRGRRGGPVHRPDPDPEHPRRDRLRDRRPAVGGRGVHRHERFGARERTGGGIGAWRRLEGPRCRVPRRRRDRDAGRRPGAVRRRRLLRLPHLGGGREPAQRRRRADRARLRRLADLGVRPARRRHLHQGGRRRRRPRRQDRGWHSRGRSAQPGRDRRQRGRQRRGLCRHGRRPVRDLCRDRRRGDAAGRAAVPADIRGGAVPARARCGVDRGLDHRNVRGAGRRPGTSSALSTRA